MSQANGRALRRQWRPPNGRPWFSTARLRTMVRERGGRFAAAFNRMSRRDQEKLLEALQALCGFEDMGFASACELLEKLGWFLARRGQMTYSVGPAITNKVQPKGERQWKLKQLQS